jgi:hypothetical protein
VFKQDSAVIIDSKPTEMQVNLYAQMDDDELQSGNSEVRRMVQPYHSFLILTRLTDGAWTKSAVLGKGVKGTSISALLWTDINTSAQGYQ